MVTKRVVCLANSRKGGGRCVAGTERDEPHTWIRPVSARPGEAVSFDERKYANGTEPQLMDIIDIPLIRACPAGHQPENWLLDPEAWWVKAGEAGWDDLGEFAFDGGPLWINGDASGRGQNNRIAVTRIHEVTDSLRLIHAPHLTVHVSTSFGDTHVDGEFDFGGTTYKLNVTDPAMETTYRALPNGKYNVGECYLTVSIGEEFHGYHYKLIAGVITKEG